MHDACLFELPKTGKWDVNRWKNLVLQYGPAVTQYLELAPRVEQYIEYNKLPFPRNPRELKEIVDAPDWARLAAKYNLSEERFDKGLDILKNRSKTQDNLPNVFIDGADFGYPNYYMCKLDIADPRGLILGEITNDCQSIGKAGEAPAVHGTTSEFGGFYVWKKKNGGKITEDDPVVAQSWAWMNDTGVLVFDSFERLSAAYNRLAQPFLEQFAYETKIKDPHHYPVAVEAAEPREQPLTDIRLGSGGKREALFIGWSQENFSDSALEGRK